MEKIDAARAARGRIIKKNGFHMPVSNEPDDVTLWGFLIHKVSVLRREVVEAEKIMWEHTKRMRNKYGDHD